MLPKEINAVTVTSNLTDKAVSVSAQPNGPVLSRSLRLRPDHLNAGLRNLHSACRQFVEMSTQVDASLPSTFDLIVGQVHLINHRVYEAEFAGNDRETILDALGQVRSLLARSPFIARLQSWPRGYPGDFETVEYLLNSTNRAERQTLAYWIESYCLNTAIAQQHRNKVRWQADQIESAIDSGVRAGKPANILIIACGSSPDLKLCLPRIADKPFQVVVNDLDRGALELSSERLVSLGRRVKQVHGNVIRRINALASHGPYDLILAGGLFDYLKDQHATFLIEAMRSKLVAPNGKIAFTNIANPNPYKYWMEYCTDWFLIERTEEDLRSLIAGCEADFSSVSITRDLTDLVLKVEITS